MTASAPELRLLELLLLLLCADEPLTRAEIFQAIPGYSCPDQPPAGAGWLRPGVRTGTGQPIAGRREPG